ncbi:MAG TPA: HPr family phosphocarrier protein [Alphaproteobacteria bacterium]|nr:HPr family phosphocarrier protein [Alphaproteobacteria bacterium]
MSSIQRTATIVNERGLHARAAVKFVKLVDTFNANVTVERGGMSVGGLSIMGLMMFGAGPGTELQLTATGPQAEAAMDALLDLIARGFDEDISFTVG